MDICIQRGRPPGVKNKAGEKQSLEELRRKVVCLVCNGIYSRYSLLSHYKVEHPEKVVKGQYRLRELYRERNAEDGAVSNAILRKEFLRESLAKDLGIPKMVQKHF